MYLWVSLVNYAVILRSGVFLTLFTATVRTVQAFSAGSTTMLFTATPLTDVLYHAGTYLDFWNTKNCLPPPRGESPDFISLPSECLRLATILAT